MKSCPCVPPNIQPHHRQKNTWNTPWVVMSKCIIMASQPFTISETACNKLKSDNVLLTSQSSHHTISETACNKFWMTMWFWPLSHSTTPSVKLPTTNSMWQCPSVLSIIPPHHQWNCLQQIQCDNVLLSSQSFHHTISDTALFTHHKSSVQLMKASQPFTDQWNHLQQTTSDSTSQCSCSS